MRGSPSPVGVLGLQCAFVVTGQGWVGNDLAMFPLSVRLSWGRWELGRVFSVVE